MSIARNPLIPEGAYRTINRRVLERLRDDLCVVERPSTGRDGSGAPTGGFSAVAGLPCRVVAPGQQPVENVGGARLGPGVDYVVRFAPDVDIRPEDHIVVNGRTLRVTADRDAISHGFELVVLTKAVES